MLVGGGFYGKNLAEAAERVLAMALESRMDELREMPAGKKRSKK